MPPLSAGKGQHRVYTIRPANPSDTAKLTAGNHYVGVDAVAWYLNKESTWFADRMASGTLKVQLADGRESYEVALGTFELSGGGTIAPVFDKPVIPDRNYRGGVLTFTATLTALRKDTALAATRMTTIVGTTPLSRVANLDGNGVFETLAYLPRAAAGNLAPGGVVGG